MRIQGLLCPLLLNYLNSSEAAKLVSLAESKLFIYAFQTHHSDRNSGTVYGGMAILDKNHLVYSLHPILDANVKRLPTNLKFSAELLRQQNYVMPRPNENRDNYFVQR